jgi:hypothetical protein
LTPFDEEANVLVDEGCCPSLTSAVQNHFKVGRRLDAIPRPSSWVDDDACCSNNFKVGSRSFLTPLTLFNEVKVLVDEGCCPSLTSAVQYHFKVRRSSLDAIILVNDEACCSNHFKVW